MILNILKNASGRGKEYKVNGRRVIISRHNSLKPFVFLLGGLSLLPHFSKKRGGSFAGSQFLEGVNFFLRGVAVFTRWQYRKKQFI